MVIRLKPSSFFLFDLDDTLYHEIYYLRSAYHAIAQHLDKRFVKNIAGRMLERYYEGKNVFEWLISEFGAMNPDLSVDKLIKIYREHKPDIQLRPDAQTFLKKLAGRNVQIGLITDGRSITQRNKIEALGLYKYVTDKNIVISEEFGSEKPDPSNFDFFVKRDPNASFYFIGDNTNKDFNVPHRLGWVTICVKDQGENIHKQDFDRPIKPQHIISSFSEIQLK